MAVPGLTAAGHEVGFGQNGGTVTNKTTGKVTSFVRKNNVYAMRIRVKRRSPRGVRDNRKSGGNRQ